MTLPFVLSATIIKMAISNLSERLARVAQPGYAGLDLLYTPSPSWPDQPESSSASASPPYPLPHERHHIAVMDSSFNPPTRAHFAIATSSYPPPSDSLFSQPNPNTSSNSASPSVSSSASRRPHTDPYTARLLLLSPRNVDKTLKPGDASWDQRVEMMVLMAKEMGENTAVGALNHPTFVGKSEILHRCLGGNERNDGDGNSALAQEGDDDRDGDNDQFENRNILSQECSSSQPLKDNITLSFLIGTDTLTRLFIEKYYPPSPLLGPNMQSQLTRFFNHDLSTFVVAHRYPSPSERESVEKYIAENSDCVRRIMEGAIRFMEIGEKERGMSSTQVREAVKKGDGERVKEMCGDSVRAYIEEKGLYKA